MAWTAPMTAVANSTLTAAQWNIHVRDNLAETAPAKATAAGRIFVTSGLNSIVERQVQRGVTNTSETTTSTSYADLSTIGPTLAITTGLAALVWWVSAAQNSGADNANYMSFEISGASTFAADDAWSLIQRPSVANQPVRAGTGYFFPLTAGSNTFTAKYKVSAGTGTYFNRQLFVLPL